VNLELVISGASAVAAIAAAIFAFRSTVIAKSALEISRQGQEARNANIVPYLVEGFRRKYDSEELIAFAVSYINQSDAPNSIVNIDIEIHYLTVGGKINHLLFPLNTKIEGYKELQSLPMIRTPLNLGARSTESGWLVFKVPRKTLTGPIEKYRVVAMTAAGKRVAVESFLIKEIRDEAQEENSK
jgi:hypothetical protein